MIRSLPILLLTLLAPGAARSQTPPASAPVPVPAVSPYIDDEKFAQSIERSVLKLAASGKGTRGKDLRSQMNRKSCDVPAAPPSAAVLAPEEIYTGCSGGVVMIASAWKAENGSGWVSGDPATAWVLTPDGVLVTNHHVFADAAKEEVFGIMTRDGAFYPVEEILAADKLNDVAIFRVAARGLQPLALSGEEPVGKKICVISHPDRQFYTFTQGQVSRYTLQRDDAKFPPVRYMCITADYARGSSGGPVLNEHGAVAGMVCSTRTTYYGEKNRDADDDVQMIVKFCIPSDSIRALLKPTLAMPAKTTPEIPPLKAIPLTEAEPPDLPPAPALPPPAAPDSLPASPPKASPVPEPDAEAETASRS